MTERRVANGAVELAVTERGDPTRPTIVLVHGYPDTSAMWRPVTHLLAERHHVVTYDVRGAGASTAPHGVEDYAMERLVEDLDAVIDAVPPGRRIHLVGHDWGSIQSWAAVSSPGVGDRIASFTSISGPSLEHVGAWIRGRSRPPSLRGIRQLLRQAGRSWYIGAFRIPGIQKAFGGGTARGFARYLHEKEGVPTDDAYPAPTFAADGAHGVNLYRANMFGRRRRPMVARTNVPVQVIVPTRDRYVTPALLDGLERIAPNLWRREVDAGHWAPRSQPVAIAGMIEEFVDHIEGGPEPRALQRARIRPGRADASKLVVVTGAGSGIGRETALAFARRGAAVVAADIDADAAARTAELARLLGTEAHAYQVDVGDTDAMENFAKWVAHEVGTPDVVVNNAGIGMGGPILDTEVADWERVLHVNLWGVIHGCRLFGRQMVERGRGGHIVNVASGAAFSPGRQFPAYATTKAAVLMLSESLRVELAPHGIGVSAICPGIVDTGIVTRTRFVGTGAEEQQRIRDGIQRMYARRRFPPSKVAAAIVRAVERNEAVVPVGPEAHLGRLVYRVSPAMARTIGRVDVAARFSGRSRKRLSS